MARGEFDRRTGVARGDEIGVLAAAFDRMADHLDESRAALAVSEARKAAVIAAALDCIVAVDGAGRILEFNPAAEHAFGYASRDVLGRHFADVLLPPPRRAAFRDAFAAYRSTGQADWLGQRLEVEAMRADGSEFPVEVAIQATAPDGGIGLTAYLRDIGDRRQAERQREVFAQSEKLRALGQMASGIAHDFNNQLGLILGYAELLLNRPATTDDGETADEMVRTIHTAARDAAAVVRGLRAFYRPAEEDDRPRAPVDLAALARQVVGLTQPRWRDQALGRGATIEVEVDAAPVPAVLGDESELREALTNLVFNAVDAMPAGGGLTLRVRPEGGGVRVEVADSGVGMPPEVRARCFEPFFTTKGEHGTGLGLAMVHGIVERHGGTVEVESPPGQGTAFVLRFPAAHPAEEARPGDARPTAGPLRVLVVDDEPRLAKLTARMLRIAGHAVECASGGDEALAALRSADFDAVLTDMAMPGMSGDELAERVKRERPGTPVVLLTGFGAIMNAAGERPAHVDLVVGKPVEASVLQAALGRVAGRASAHASR
jgi:PAS domain S-box-containing protein